MQNSALDVDLPQEIEYLFMNKRYDLSDIDMDDIKNIQIKEVAEWIRNK
jgi:hypothetical protein